MFDWFKNGILKPNQIQLKLTEAKLPYLQSNKINYLKRIFFKQNKAKPYTIGDLDEIIDQNKNHNRLIINKK